MDGIGYMQDLKACVDGNGAYGIILRLIAQSGLDEEVLDTLVVELDDYVSKAQSDNTLTDEDLINICAKNHNREDMTIGMMLAAQYIRGILTRYTHKHDERQKADALRSDHNLN